LRQQLKRPRKSTDRPPLSLLPKTPLSALVLWLPILLATLVMSPDTSQLLLIQLPPP
jgi:hypothetical protein